MINALLMSFQENPLGWVLFLLFYAIMGFFLYKNRKKIQRQSIVFLYRTKAGIKLIDKLSKCRFWKYWGYAGIGFGFLGMIFIVGYLITIVIKFLISPSGAISAVKILVPGPFAADTSLVMVLPIEYFVPALLVVILVHEGCHGIITRFYQLKILSTGLGLFLILPLAFVEPDEKAIEKIELRKKLSIFAAGPFANFSSALIILAIIIALFNPFIFGVSAFYKASENPVVFELNEGGPSELAGVPVGDDILALNGVEVKSSEDFRQVISEYSPGDIITLTTSSGDYAIETIEHPTVAGLPYAGVMMSQQTLWPIFDSDFFIRFIQPILSYISVLFQWIVILNIGIGLFNLLPLGPTDGGRMVQSVFDKYIKNKNIARKAFKAVSLTTLFILLIAIFGPLFISIVSKVIPGVI